MKNNKTTSFKNTQFLLSVVFMLPLLGLFTLFFQTLFSPVDNMENFKPTEKRVKSARKEQIALGAVIPHHAVAESLQTAAFEKLVQNRSDVEQIIIIGPNHDNVGEFAVVVQAELEEVERDLLDISFVGSDKNLVQSEHSIQGLLPFVDEYFPEAEVTALVLKRNLRLDELELLRDSLGATFHRKKTLVLASIDFSHYLSCQQTLLNDEKTLDLIKKRDYGGISVLSPEFIDSPSSLNLFLSLMDFWNSEDYNLLEHSNSCQLQNQNFPSSTSYMTMIFYGRAY